MPREQTTAPHTVAAFSALGYHPPGRAAIVITTTEREAAARAGHRDNTGNQVYARPPAGTYLKPTARAVTLVGGPAPGRPTCHPPQPAPAGADSRREVLPWTRPEYRAPR
ncbi:hypothetical protein GCM10010400_00190 [Streptomyces aculeolatus]